MIMLETYLKDKEYVTINIGDYKYSAVLSNHNGWLLCDGSAVSRITYASLFAIIGTSFGSGDGSTTFNLPDTRGRVIGAIGQGSGLTNRTLGQIIGAENVILTSANLPDPLTSTSGVQTIKSGAGASALGINDVAGTGKINNTGSNQPFSNMQPTLFAGNLFIFSGVYDG